MIHTQMKIFGWFIIYMSLQTGESGLAVADNSAFHLPQLTGQTIPVIMRISLLIKAIQPDQSKPKLK